MQKIFVDVKNCLDEQNIQYWLDSGTLLGVVRDKNMIEWDRDIDLAIIFIETIDIVAKNLYLLGYDVFISDSKLTVRKDEEHLSIYFYHIKEMLGKKYLTRYKVSKRDAVADFIQYVYLESVQTPFEDRIHNPTIRQQIVLVLKDIARILPFKKWVFNRLISYGVKYKHFERYLVDIEYSFLSGFKQVTFFGEKVNIPKYYEEYLEVMYGNDWKIPNKEWSSWDFFNLMNKRNQKLDLLFHLEMVIHILNNRHLHFWMYGGALLGFVRNGEMISWDNDIDLFVWKEDYNKLFEMKKEFEKCGFKVLIKEKSMDLIWGEKSIGFQYYTLSDDKAIIYDRLVTRNKMGNIIYFGLLCKASKYNMKNTVFLLKLLLLKLNICYVVTQVVPSYFFLNLKEIDFFGLKLKVPHDIEQFLEYTFGKDWKIPKEKFQRPTNYYVYGGLPDSRYRKYYRGKKHERSRLCID